MDDSQPTSWARAAGKVLRRVSAFVLVLGLFRVYRAFEQHDPAAPAIAAVLVGGGVLSFVLGAMLERRG